MLNICEALNVQPKDFLSPIFDSTSQNVYFNPNQKTISLDEKLIEQYELRIKEKDNEITFLRAKLLSLNISSH